MFRSVKLIAKVPKSGTTVKTSKTKNDGAKKRYAARLGLFQYLAIDFNMYTSL